MTHKEKINKAIEVITDALSKAKNPFVGFTGDKDSLTTLDMVRRIRSGSISVVFIDTSVYFNEIYRFVEKMRKLWGFILIKEKNEEALKTIKIAENRAECCLQLKEEALKISIKKYNIDYFFTGIIGGDQEERRNEEYISKRDEHIRVNPIVDFSEKDVWDYIKKYNLPFCSLYNKGFKSIDCAPCTKPAEKLEEHSARSQDNEKIMKQLRQLGYFS